MSPSGEAFEGALGIPVRRLAAPDVPAVSGILQQSPEASNWSEQSLVQLASAGPASWVAERDGVVAGFLLGRSAADEFEILNLAVSRAYRRGGIGSKLLETAVEFSRSAGISHVYLEVRASNKPAIALYTRHGFNECGRRAQYYKNPMEDAVLLSIRLGG
jgi:[ribosomal protein S18]-alanine N-acetyltransferase